MIKEYQVNYSSIRHILMLYYLFGRVDQRKFKLRSSALTKQIQMELEQRKKQSEKKKGLIEIECGPDVNEEQVICQDSSIPAATNHGTSKPQDNDDTVTLQDEDVMQDASNHEHFDQTIRALLHQYKSYIVKGP